MKKEELTDKRLNEFVLKIIEGAGMTAVDREYLKEKLSQAQGKDEADYWEDELADMACRGQVKVVAEYTPADVLQSIIDNMEGGNDAR